MDAENKEKIEEILKLYPALRSKLYMKMTNYNEIELPLNAISHSLAKSGKTNKIHSDIENHITKIEDVEEDIKRIFKVVKSIEIAFDSLPVMQKKVIKKMYFKDLKNEDIAVDIEKSEKTVRNYRDRAFIRLKNTGLLDIYRKITTELLYN